MCSSHVLTICPLCVYNDFNFFDMVFYLLLFWALLLKRDGSCCPHPDDQSYFLSFSLIFCALLLFFSMFWELLCVRSSSVLSVLIRLTKLSLSCVYRLSYLHFLSFLAAHFLSNVLVFVKSLLSLWFLVFILFMLLTLAIFSCTEK